MKSNFVIFIIFMHLLMKYVKPDGRFDITYMKAHH
jgi:hypothetical protein